MLRHMTVHRDVGAWMKPKCILRGLRKFEEDSQTSSIACGRQVSSFLQRKPHQHKAAHFRPPRSSGRHPFQYQLSPRVH